MNVGMDYNWFRSDSANQTAMMTRMMKFFKNDGYQHGYFDWDGSNPSGSYSEGMAGANGVGAFALNDKDLQKEYVNKLWNTSAPSGQWRYYNGMVYFLSMLHVSGNFKIYKPVPETVDTTATGTFNGVKYDNDTTFTAIVDCKVYNVTIKADHTGTDNLAAESFSVSPNPARDVININTTEDVATAIIYDLTGKQIAQSNEKSIAISNIKSGLYLLKVTLKSGEEKIAKLSVIK